MDQESWIEVKDKRNIQEVFEGLVSKNIEHEVLMDEQSVRFMSQDV